MSDCTGTLHPRAREGLRLFNAGEYFEAHEALEDAWNAEEGDAKDLYRGIFVMVKQKMNTCHYISQSRLANSLGESPGMGNP